MEENFGISCARYTIHGSGDRFDIVFDDAKEPLTRKYDRAFHKKEKRILVEPCL